MNRRTLIRHSAALLRSRLCLPVWRPTRCRWPRRFAVSPFRRSAGLPGIRGHEPDLDAARRQAREIGRAIGELKTVAPRAGCYVAEGDFLAPDWAHSYWGPNYEKLLSIKKKYDPDGLFFVDHGVGSEE